MWEVSADHADYLLTGGVNALDEFAPGFELVDDETPCGPAAEALAAAPPAGPTGELFGRTSEPEGTPAGESEGEGEGESEGEGEDDTESSEPSSEGESEPTSES